MGEVYKKVKKWHCNSHSPNTLQDRNLHVPNQKVGHASDQEKSVTRGDRKAANYIFLFSFFAQHFTSFTILPSLFLADSWNPDLSRIKNQIQKN